MNQWLWYDHATPIFPDLLDPAFEGQACAGWNLQRMATYSKYLLIGLPVAVLASCAALWLREKLRKRCFKEVGRVSGIFVYPVKSCKGIRVRDMKCFKEGMEYDRWDIRKAMQLTRPACSRVCLDSTYIFYIFWITLKKFESCSTEEFIFIVLVNRRLKCRLQTWLNMRVKERNIHSFNLPKKMCN